MRTKEYTYLTVIVFIIFLSFGLPFVSAKNIDIGHVNFPDPIIEVTYDEPVTVLEGQTFIAFYTLSAQTTIGTQVESSLGTGFVRKHNISPSAGTLASRSYILTVSAQNVEGISTTDSVTFNVTGLDMALINPQTNQEISGFFNYTPYNLTFQTFVFDGETNEKIPFNTECKYMYGKATSLISFEDPLLYPMNRTSQPVASTLQYQTPENSLGTIHERLLEQTPISDISVFCRNYKRDGTPLQPIIRHFEIGYLATPPTMSLSTNPTTVINFNNPIVSIVAQTNQEAYCTIANGTSLDVVERIPFASGATRTNFSSYTTSHNHVVSYNQAGGVNTNLQGDLQAHTFTYQVQCANRAGLSTTRNISVTVDLDTGLQISFLSPSSSTTASNFLELSTNLPAVCTLNTSSQPLQGDSRTHNTTLSGLQSGRNYSYEVFCRGTNEGLGKNATASLFFTYDTAPPTLVLQAKDPLCPNNAVVVLNSSSPDVEYYYWNVTREGLHIDSGRITHTQLRLLLQQPGTYTFSAYARDFAGLNSTTRTLSLPVLAQTDLLCQNVPVQNNTLSNGSTTTDPSVPSQSNSCPYSTCMLDDICNEACALESACSPDPDCAQTPQTPSESTCPYTCVQDNMCVEGCAAHTSCQEDVDCLKEFPWLAFAFVFLGFVLLAGSGYYLYFMNEQRKQQNGPSFSSTQTNISSQTSATTVQQPSQFPVENKSVLQERTKLLEEIEARKKKILQTHNAKEQERRAKRESVFSAFDENAQKQPAQEEPPKQNTPSQEEVQNTSSLQKAPEDTRNIFEKLDSFIKRNKK